MMSHRFSGPEDERVKVEVVRPTLIAGSWFEPGDEVEVYPAQARSLVAGGYIKGEELEEAWSPGELAIHEERGERSVLEPAPSQEEYFEKHDIGQGAEGESVVVEDDGAVGAEESEGEGEDRSGKGYEV